MKLYFMKKEALDIFKNNLDFVYYKLKLRSCETTCVP